MIIPILIAAIVAIVILALALRTARQNCAGLERSLGVSRTLHQAVTEEVKVLSRLVGEWQNRAAAVGIEYADLKTRFDLKEAALVAVEHKNEIDQVAIDTLTQGLREANLSNAALRGDCDRALSKLDKFERKRGAGGKFQGKDPVHNPMGLTSPGVGYRFLKVSELNRIPDDAQFFDVHGKWTNSFYRGKPANSEDRKTTTYRTKIS